MFSAQMSKTHVYSKTAFIVELYILILVALPMVLEFHSLFIALKLFRLFPV